MSEPGASFINSRDNVRYWSKNGSTAIELNNTTNQTRIFKNFQNFMRTILKIPKTTGVTSYETVSKIQSQQFVNVQDLVGNFLSTEFSNDAKGFTYNIVPEVGDVILWNNDYYEVDGIVESQYFMGKYPEYSYSSDNDNFGTSLSIILSTHYMRPEKLGLNQERI